MCAHFQAQSTGKKTYTHSYTLSGESKREEDEERRNETRKEKKMNGLR